MLERLSAFILGLGSERALRLMFFGLIVGIVSGIGASLFFFVLSWGKFLAFDVLAGFSLPEPPGERIIFMNVESSAKPWLLFLLPAIGGLLSGWIVYTFAPETEGHGIDAMLDAFHNKRGQIRGRVPLVKGLASIVTLATGGSAGREGPIAQIGAGFGSWIGRVLEMSPRERRLLLLAGTAGGLGAIFRAPLGGAITSIEILYREDFESEGIIPCVISSVTAYTVFTYLFGNQPIFEVPPFKILSPKELASFTILGLLCAPLGILYIKLFYGCRNRIFKKIPIRPHFIPAIGGFGVGILSLISPNVLGGGYGVIQSALLGHLSLELMAVLIFLKMLATSFTIGSGGSGGVFGPSLFIGGMIGGVVGKVAHMIAPGVVVCPEAYVLVGMASFFAGVASAPVGALLMVSEMTEGYSLLPPLMLVSCIALILTRKWSIYEKQAKNKFDSPAHAADATINVLRSMQVKSVFNPESYSVPLPEDLKLKDLVNVVAHSNETFYPVVNANYELVGILSLSVIRKYLFESSPLYDLVVVGELASKPITLTLNDDIYTALTKFVDSGYGELPVVDTQDRKRMVGVLKIEAIFSAYREEIARLREEAG